MHSDWKTWKLQFRCLYRVFFMRVIDLELMSADADPSRLIGQFATIFITISILFSLPILVSGGRGLSLAGQWTGEHFFIETTITLAGLITVLNWDSAFPDKRDILVLAPLPVSASTLFLAKISALCSAPALAMLAFNLFIGVAWPLAFFSGHGGFLGAIRAWPAYWLTCFLGGAFCISSVLAIQGLAANLLSRRYFLRLSAFLQAAALCLLLSTYFLEPSFKTAEAFTAPENQRRLTWLPSYWFLGLFQQLNGSMHPALAPLAKRAWIGLTVSLLGTAAALLLSYFRTLPKTVEQPDIAPGVHAASWSLPIGNSLSSAVTLFSLRTLLRNRQHRTILSFYFGVGLALVLGFIETKFVGISTTKTGISVAFLLASILMMMLAIMAIRVVAAIPISLPAHWIIRVTQTKPAHDYQRAVRFSWLALVVAPIVLLLAGAFLTAYPWKQVAGHLLIMFLMGALLVELCLYAFRKIPFTCSYLPGKANLHFAFWACLLFLTRFLKEGAVFENHILQSFGSSSLLVLFLVTFTLAVRLLAKARTTREDELLFEEEEPVQTISLKLG